MPERSEEFQRLALKFETLVENLSRSQNAKARTRVLRRMREVLDEIDKLMFSGLETRRGAVDESSGTRHCVSGAWLTQGRNRERWMKLCEQAANEQDSDRLLALVKEINRLIAQGPQSL